MIKTIKKLLVKYNEQEVGYLIDLDNKVAFEYSDYWLKNGFSISPLSLPLVKKVFINNKANMDYLFGVFHDSLPDGWGNLLLKRKMAQIGINYDNLSNLTKLSLISNNGLGGLSYEPMQLENELIYDLDLDKIAKETEKIFMYEHNDINIDEVYLLGGSSGGSRPKIHVKIDDEEWIIKFPCSFDPKNISVEEYKANELAKLCNINTNVFKLFKSKNNNSYFGVKRFDRNKLQRIHMISLSSILETSHLIPNLDYCHLFQIIKQISVDSNDFYEAYKRMCFNVLFGNKDDHGKNFAFLYDEVKGGYVLSPFYDITKTNNKFEHEMTVNGKGNPNKEDLLEIAKKFNLSIEKCIDIIEVIENNLKKY